VHPYTETIHTLFCAHADPAEAAPMRRYMRDQFAYLGIKIPQMRALLNGHIEVHGLPVLAEL
jgi:hypothetical protein